MKVRALYSCNNSKYTENKEYTVIESTNNLKGFGVELS